jgi:hypothetical protein
MGYVTVTTTKEPSMTTHQPTRIGEMLLMKAYGLGLRVERCACGGFIGAALDDEPEAVLAHNQSELHQMWRCWADTLDEMPGPDVLVIAESMPLLPPDPTTPVNTRDVSGRRGTSGLAGAAA